MFQHQTYRAILGWTGWDWETGAGTHAKIDPQIGSSLAAGPFILAKSIIHATRSLNWTDMHGSLVTAFAQNSAQNSAVARAFEFGPGSDQTDLGLGVIKRAAVETHFAAEWIDVTSYRVIEKALPSATVPRGLKICRVRRGL